MADLGATLCSHIASGDWVRDPSLLLGSAITIFADLKK
jgi:hypothetical protein